MEAAHQGFHRVCSWDQLLGKGRDCGEGEVSCDGVSPWRQFFVAWTLRAIEEGAVFPGGGVWPWVNALFSWDSSYPVVSPAPREVISSLFEGESRQLITVSAIDRGRYETVFAHCLFFKIIWCWSVWSGSTAFSLNSIIYCLNISMSQPITLLKKIYVKDLLIK